MFNKLNISLLILCNCFILSLYLIDESEATKKILYGLAMASIINAARSPQFGQRYKQIPSYPIPYPIMIPRPLPPKVEEKKASPPPKECNRHYHCHQNDHYQINEIYDLGHSIDGYGGHSFDGYGGGGRGYNRGGYKHGVYSSDGYGGHSGGGGGCNKCQSCKKKRQLKKIDYDYDGYEESYDGQPYNS